MNTKNLLDSIAAMLGEVNGCPAAAYGWVYESEQSGLLPCLASLTEAQLAKVQGKWMINYPKAWAKHGIYVM
jgi:hypothetical protein